MSAAPRSSDTNRLQLNLWLQVRLVCVLCFFSVRFVQLWDQSRKYWSYSARCNKNRSFIVNFDQHLPLTLVFPLVGDFGLLFTSKCGIRNPLRTIENAGRQKSGWIHQNIRFLGLKICPLQFKLEFCVVTMHLEIDGRSKDLVSLDDFICGFGFRQRKNLSRELSK